MRDYPSNSIKTKEEQREKKIEKVVTSPVKTKKKSEVRKLTDIFIAEDIGNVVESVCTDVLVPALKKTLSEMVTNAVDMLLYGESRSSSRSSSPAGKVSYRSYYGSNSNERDSYRTRGIRKTYDYDDIIIPNRGDAERVLMAMDEIMKEYRVVSVADFYELVDVSGTYTDNNYGWTDISSARVDRVRDGYIIRLPRALPID